MEEKKRSSSRMPLRYFYSIYTHTKS